MVFFQSKNIEVLFFSNGSVWCSCLPENERDEKKVGKGKGNKEQYFPHLGSKCPGKYLPQVYLRVAEGERVPPAF